MTYGRKFLLLRASTALCLLLSFTGEVFAAPSISSVSGSVSKNAQLNIAGAEFGSRGDYHTHNNSGLAWAWKDYEDGLLTSDGWYGAPGPGVLQSSVNRPGSQYWITTPSGSSPRKYGSMGASTTIFMSFWTIFSSNYAGKFLRFRLHDEGNYGNPPLSHNDFWLATAGGTNWMIRGNSDTSTQGTIYNSHSIITPGVWWRFDLLLVPDSQIPYKIGAFNNLPQWDDSTIDDALLHDEVSRLPGSHFTLADPGGQVEINLGGGGNTAGTLPQGIDDVYIDFTQARVELCDSSTWSNSSHCEIQVPLAWSPTSITIKVNRGSFASGDTAYLYVVDANGSVNGQGFRVTVGLDAPSPITTLRIIP